MQFPSADKVVVVVRSAAERAGLVGTVPSTGLIFYVPDLAFQRYDAGVGTWVNFGPPNGWARFVPLAANVTTDDSYMATLLQMDGTGAERTVTLHEPGFTGFKVGVRRTNAGGSNVVVAADSIDGGTIVTLMAPGFLEFTWTGAIWTITGAYLP